MMSEKRLTQIFENSLDVSKKLITIGFEHSKIHEGNFFSFQGFIEGLTATTGVLYFGFETDGKYIHYQPTTVITNSAKLKVEFFEDCIYTDGTLQSLKNKNRNYKTSNLPTSILTLSPNITDFGTMFSNFVILGVQGNENKRSGGVGSSATEWVLEPDKQYLAKVSNLSDTDSDVYIDFEFYEGGGAL